MWSWARRLTVGSELQEPWCGYAVAVRPLMEVEWRLNIKAEV